MSEEIVVSGDADALALAVLEEARAEAAALLAEAGAEAAKTIAASAARSEAGREALLSAARAAAGRRREALLAAAPVEAARIRAALLEQKLEAVKAAAARLLVGKQVPETAPALARLAAQAIAGMAGGDFVVEADAAAAEALRALAPEIERLAGKGPLRLDFEAGGPAGGGVAVRDAAGRRRWDNGFAERLERLWPEQRARLAGRNL